MVDNEVDEGGLRRVKMQIFRPPTWAVFRCKLKVQMQADSEHSKDMFQVQFCPGRSMGSYIKFGGKQA